MNPNESALRHVDRNNPHNLAPQAPAEPNALGQTWTNDGEVLLSDAARNRNESALRADVVKLANEHPEFRADLVPLLRNAFFGFGKKPPAPPKPAAPKPPYDNGDDMPAESESDKLDHKKCESGSHWNEEDHECKPFAGSTDGMDVSDQSGRYEASLRAAVVKLAAEKPGTRKYLLPLLRQAAKKEEFNAKCPSCNGSGDKDGKDCEDCAGHGRITQEQADEIRRQKKDR